MRAESKIKGNIGESAVLFEFVKHGIPVALPYGDNERYDLIAEFNGKLNKIQIKYCDCSSGTTNGIICPCASSMNHTAKREGWESYENDVDYLAYYFPRYRTCCLVPISIIGSKKSITMNFSETKPISVNGKSVNWYKDFSFDTILAENVGSNPSGHTAE